MTTSGWVHPDLPKGSTPSRGWHDEFKNEPTDTENHILSMLAEVDELREYWCWQFIAKFAKKEPDILLSLSEERKKREKNLYHLKDIYQEVVNDWKKRTDFPDIFERIISWAAQDDVFGLITRSILDIFYDDETLKIVKDSVNQEEPDSIVKAADIISNFPKDSEFFNSFADLLEVAEKHSGEIFKKVARIFQSATFYGEINRTVGQPSDFHLNIKAQCEKILISRNFSRNLRKIFEDCIKSVEHQIEKDLTEDKEMFDE